MIITREIVADRLKDYLLGRLPLKDLVYWAEEAMAEGEIEDRDFEIIRDIVARLGLGDVPAFGLTWDAIQDMLRRLGYRTWVEFEPMV